MSVDTKMMRAEANRLRVGCIPWHARELLEQAASELEALRRQLPAEMPGCTIVFKKCEHGHGRLVGTNWVDPGCIACERDELRAGITKQWRDSLSEQICTIPMSAFPYTPRRDPVCDCMPHDGPEGCHTMACATVQERLKSTGCR